MVNTARNAAETRNSRASSARTRFEIYALIDYRPAAAPCGGKANRSRVDAMEAAALHNDRYVCGDMEAYPCERHRAWHIGHASFRRRKNLRLREDYAWFVLWASEAAGNAA